MARIEDQIADAAVDAGQLVRATTISKRERRTGSNAGLATGLPATGDAPVHLNAENVTDIGDAALCGSEPMKRKLKTYTATLGFHQTSRAEVTIYARSLAEAQRKAEALEAGDV